MNSMTTKLDRIKRLVLIAGAANAALVLLAFICSLAAYSVAGRLGSDPDQDQGPLRTLFWLLPLMKYLCQVCLVLTLLWLSTLVIYFLRLKALKRERDA
jgi:hypothetical protein